MMYSHLHPTSSMVATSPYSYYPQPQHSFSYPPAPNNYFPEPHYNQPPISAPTLKFIKFSGSDPNFWLLQAELFFLHHPWQLEYRFDFIALHLEGFALTWFQLWRHQLDSWDKFREVFKFQFGQLRSGHYEESSVSGLENTTVGLENTTMDVSQCKAEHIKQTRIAFALGDEPHVTSVAELQVVQPHFQIEASSEEQVLAEVVSTAELGNDETETESKGSSTNNESSLITTQVVSTLFVKRSDAIIPTLVLETNDLVPRKPHQVFDKMPEKVFMPKIGNAYSKMHVQIELHETDTKLFDPGITFGVPIVTTDNNCYNSNFGVTNLSYLCHETKQANHVWFDQFPHPFGSLVPKADLHQIIIHCENMFTQLCTISFLDSKLLLSLFFKTETDIIELCAIVIKLFDPGIVQVIAILTLIFDQHDYAAISRYATRDSVLHYSAFSGQPSAYPIQATPVGFSLWKSYGHTGFDWASRDELVLSSMSFSMASTCDLSSQEGNRPTRSTDLQVMQNCVAAHFDILLAKCFNLCLLEWKMMRQVILFSEIRLSQLYGKVITLFDPGILVAASFKVCVNFASATIPLQAILVWTDNCSPKVIMLHTSSLTGHQRLISIRTGILHSLYDSPPTHVFAQIEIQSYVAELLTQIYHPVLAVQSALGAALDDLPVDPFAWFCQCFPISPSSTLIFSNREISLAWSSVDGAFDTNEENFRRHLTCIMTRMLKETCSTQLNLGWDSANENGVWLSQATDSERTSEGSVSIMGRDLDITMVWISPWGALENKKSDTCQMRLYENKPFDPGILMHNPSMYCTHGSPPTIHHVTPSSLYVAAPKPSNGSNFAGHSMRIENQEINFYQFLLALKIHTHVMDCGLLSWILIIAWILRVFRAKSTHYPHGFFFPNSLEDKAYFKGESIDRSLISWASISWARNS